MINRQEGGLKQGFWIEPEGVGQWTGYYDHGKREGSWNYYEGRSLLKTVRYLNDLKQGRGFKFGMDGRLLLALEFDNDRIHGKARFFSSDGDLIATYAYVYDKLDRVELYVLHDESPPKDKIFLPEF